ncbi:hypothetical protein D3C77_617770 [compost metagenome]
MSLKRELSSKKGDGNVLNTSNPLISSNPDIGMKIDTLITVKLALWGQCWNRS